jgi:RNA polymerase sigma factor (sigma-70 family)
MARVVSSPLLQLVRRLVEHRRLTEVPDEELLRQFRVGHDEASFHALVRRHGPMVLDVCRAVLRHEADAEDAFQATFLVLAREAGSIRRSAALGSWLHGVAYRTALKAQAMSAKRRAHEARAASREALPAQDLSWGEAQRVLHEELSRLAERHRAALVLCYLQGKTQDEAAAVLGLTKATLKRRLEQARALLRTRLVRRGLGPAALLIASAWPAAAATASAVPAALMFPTVKAALLVAAGQAAAGVVSATAAALAEGVFKDMLPTKIKIATALLLALATIGTGAAVLAYQAAADKPAASAAGPEAGERRPAGADPYGDRLPAGALARMGTTRLRHAHSSFSLATAFSPDGKVLATGGNEEVRLWDVASGWLLREIREGYLHGGSILFAPDGRWLATGDFGSVHVWDPATGRRLCQVPVELGRALAASADGKLLATAAKDGSVLLWDVATGRQAAQLRGGHAQAVFQATFTADGKGLVSLCQANRVCHWDLGTGELRKGVDLRLPARTWAALTPDGQTALVAPIVRKPEPEPSAALWDTDTGKERAKLQGELPRVGFGLAFSRDGKTLALNEADPYGWPALVPVSLWDARTGQFVRRLRLPVRGIVNALDFSPDGRTLLTSGNEPLVRLWDAVSGKSLKEWPAHEDRVQALAFLADGRSLLSGSADGTVRLWEVASGKHLRQLSGHRWGVSAVAVSPDGKLVVSAGHDGCVRVRDADGQEQRRIVLGRPPEELDQREHLVLGLALKPDNKTAVTWTVNPNAGKAAYDLGDLTTGKVLTNRPYRGAVIRPAHEFSPDGQFVLEYVPREGAGAPAAGGGGPAPGAGGPGGGGGGPGGAAEPAWSAELYEVTTGERRLTIPLPDLPAEIQAFAPDGRTLLTATFRSEKKADDWQQHTTLQLWELATGKERLTIPCGSPRRLTRAAVSPDNRTLATAHDDRTIQLWDLATGKELLRREAPDAPARCLAFAPDSRSLASGHTDGTVLVWDLAGAKAARAGAKPDAAQVERWWADLAGADARKAHSAIHGLRAAPESALRLCREGLRPVAEAPADKVRQLVAELDSEQFARREAATKGLAALGEGAIPALRAALKDRLSAEQRRGVEGVLAALDTAGESVRHLRAVEVLELLGNDEARRLLETLARGVPEARLTREASAAAGRLARRPAKP